MRGIPADAPDRARSRSVLYTGYVCAVCVGHDMVAAHTPTDASRRRFTYVMMAALTLVRLGEVFKVTVTARTERFIKIL